MSKDNLYESALKFVGEKTGVGRDEIMSSSRRKRPSSARVVFALCCYRNGASKYDISTFLNKDHTTVLYYFKSANQDEIELSEGFSYLANSPLVVPVGASDGGSIFPVNSRYRKAYEMYGYRCAIPECYRDDVLEVHHVIPRRSGGTDDIHNLIVLCPTHHALADRGALFVKPFNIYTKD